METIHATHVKARLYLDEMTMSFCEAFLARLRERGFDHVTVVYGAFSFGTMRKRESPDDPTDRPSTIIEVIDAKASIYQSLIPIINEMIPHGILTLEGVHVMAIKPRLRNPYLISAKPKLTPVSSGNELSKP